MMTMLPDHALPETAQRAPAKLQAAATHELVIHAHALRVYNAQKDGETTPATAQARLAHAELPFSDIVAATSVEQSAYVMTAGQGPAGTFLCHRIVTTSTRTADRLVSAVLNAHRAYHTTTTTSTKRRAIAGSSSPLPPTSPPPPPPPSSFPSSPSPSPSTRGFGFRSRLSSVADAIRGRTSRSRRSTPTNSTSSRNHGQGHGHRGTGPGVMSLPASMRPSMESLDNLHLLKSRPGSQSASGSNSPARSHKHALARSLDMLAAPSQVNGGGSGSNNTCSSASASRVGSPAPSSPLSPHAPHSVLHRLRKGRGRAQSEATAAAATHGTRSRSFDDSLDDIDTDLFCMTGPRAHNELEQVKEAEPREEAGGTGVEHEEGSKGDAGNDAGTSAADVHSAAMWRALGCHGVLSFEEVSRLLLSPPPAECEGRSCAGSWLLRATQDETIPYAVSLVSARGTLKHINVFCHDGLFKFSGQPDLFEDVPSLIAHFHGMEVPLQGQVLGKQVLPEAPVSP